jgi:ribonuclease T2
MIRIALAIALLAAPTVAEAQAYACAVPAQVPRPRPDLPTPEQPRRVLPIGGYTLAISWAAQFCHNNASDAAAKFECGSGNRIGFTLHGLWPDGEGAEWPQYCRATPIVPAPVIRGQLCATPSAQLIQHEWAKHGTCMSRRPADYFAKSSRLYAGLRYPDMDALSRREDLTASDVAKAIAGANRGIDADMMRITANKSGWLEEVWLCLDKQFGYARCPAHQGGLATDAPIKIWRGASRR